MADMTHVREKEKTIKNLEEMIEKNGNDLKIIAIKVEQGAGAGLYTGATSIRFLNTCIERLPRTYEEKDGIQRVLKPASVAEIKEKHRKKYVWKRDEKCDTPNSLTIMLKECMKGKYYDVEHLASDKQICITVHLGEVLKYLNSKEAKVDEDGFLLEPEKATLGYMIDGHHRNEGAYLAACEYPEHYEYEFPTSIYIDRKREEIPEIFDGINNKQQKPSATHTTAIRAMSGKMVGDEKEANEMMQRLNSWDGSVLKDRIKMIDGRRPKGMLPTFIGNTTMLELIKNWIESMKGRDWFDEMTDEEKIELLNDYFSAYKEVFPNAWGSSEFVLTKSMGFKIIFSIFEKIEDNAAKAAGTKIPNQNDFVKQLRVKFFQRDPDGNFVKDDEGNDVPKSVCVDGVNHVPFDWSSETYGALSSGKGINSLKKIVRDLISSSVV